MRLILPVAVAIIGLINPAVAMAGANKTWVSGTGKDTGTCPISAPCASFQYAVNQTAAGGEVDVKDAGGYGVVTITKSISIVADGVLASISVPAGGVGITVSAGTSDVVTLKGLTIDGHGVGQYGVKETQALLLAVEDSTVQGMTSAGITADLPAITGFFGLNIMKSIIRNNNIGVKKSGGLSFGANLVDSVISHNTVGFSMDNTYAEINHCVFEFNSKFGVDNEGVIFLTDSHFAFNISNNFGDINSPGDNVINDYGGNTATFQGFAKK